MKTQDEVCPRCNGSKRIAYANHPAGSAAEPNWIPCPDCDGTGKKKEKPNA